MSGRGGINVRQASDCSSQGWKYEQVGVEIEHIGQGIVSHKGHRGKYVGKVSYQVHIIPK